VEGTALVTSSRPDGGPAPASDSTNLEEAPADLSVHHDEPSPAPEKKKGKDYSKSWTPEVEALLRDWERRSTVAEHAYYAKSERLRAWNYLLGIPVVIVTAVVGTAVFASLSKSSSIDFHAKLWIGGITMLAAVLAGIQTFTKLGEAAQINGAAGDWYASIRRDIEQALSLPPEFRDPAKDVVDSVRKEMNKASQKSPELGERWWGPFAEAYGVADLVVEDRLLWWMGPPRKVTRRGRPAQKAKAAAPSADGAAESVSGTR